MQPMQLLTNRSKTVSALNLQHKLNTQRTP
jgi:hypothetical protein